MGRRYDYDHRFDDDPPYIGEARMPERYDYSYAMRGGPSPMQSISRNFGAPFIAGETTVGTPAAVIFVEKPGMKAIGWISLALAATGCFFGYRAYMRTHPSKR